MWELATPTTWPCGKAVVSLWCQNTTMDWHRQTDRQTGTHTILQCVRAECWGKQNLSLTYPDSFTSSDISGISLMGQDSTWWWKAASSPCQPHPLSLWLQNTRSEFTWRWKCLFNIVLQLCSLHSRHGSPSCILVAASCERCLPQHDVRWGWSSSSFVMGQKKSSDGCSTNEYSSSAAHTWPGSLLKIWT